MLICCGRKSLGLIYWIGIKVVLKYKRDFKVLNYFLNAHICTHVRKFNLVPRATLLLQRKDALGKRLIQTLRRTLMKRIVLLCSVYTVTTVKSRDTKNSKNQLLNYPFQNSFSKRFLKTLIILKLIQQLYTLLKSGYRLDMKRGLLQFVPTTAFVCYKFFESTFWNGLVSSVL